MKNFLKNSFRFLFFSISCFSAAYLLYKAAGNDFSPIQKGVSSILHAKEKKLESEITILAQQAQTKSYEQLFRDNTRYHDLFQKEGLVLLIYENDTLKFWSDNSVAVENYLKEVCLDDRMAKLKNGWFEVVRPKLNATGPKIIVGLILIKNEYPYQNQYLINTFQKDFHLNENIQLMAGTKTTGYPIYNYKGEYLFSLRPGTENISETTTNYLSLFLYLLGMIFILVFLTKKADELSGKINRNFSILLFALCLIAFRFLSIKIHFPVLFYDLPLFSPKYYGDATSFWLPSLGDFLINALLLFYLSYFIHKRFTIAALPKLKTAFRIFAAFAVLLFVFWISWLLNLLIIGLIANSSISYDLNNIFSLNLYSYIGFIIIGLILFSFFLLIDKLMDGIHYLKLNQVQWLLSFILAGALHTLIAHYYGTLDLVVIMWSFVIVLAVFRIKKRKAYSFSTVIFLLLVFSLYTVHAFLKHNRFKENESRKVFAEKLAAEQDPIAEHLFRDIEQKIRKDSVLISYLSQPLEKRDPFEKRLRQEYFSGYWEKYDIRIALFDTMCVPLLKTTIPNSDNTLFFDEKITNQGKETFCEHFYFLNNSSGKISYIARIPVHANTSSEKPVASLYVELDSKFVSEEIGFPELLLDRSIGINQELSNYSYGKYKGGQLINQYGKFPYSLSAKDWPSLQKGMHFIDLDGYNHLLYQYDAQTLIILSKKEEGIVDEVTTFSYLFAFFSLLLLLILLFRNLPGGISIRRLSFKYRIQALLVLIVLTSLALFGGGTIYYIKQQYETKNKESISEKAHSVLIELENKFAEEDYLTNDLREYAAFTLRKFSNVFFTDINLYDRYGNLYASSRPKVFDEGLTSKKMNPKAFLEIAVKEKTEFIHKENIGELNYLSAYVPFKNREGKFLAFINIPYFAKQSELQKEISGFLTALINIYVLLFAMSIIIAIFISNYITKPLKLIQDKFSNIQLGKTNELIRWKQDDEIGNLVREYNRMIIELSQSAELLARSERESAWREMAKQVAHEIKNPLTPMKLSVQHLQRMWDDKAPDMDARIKRLAQTLIEQIDALSSIAGEFSSFAKMPKANREKVNLSHVVQSSIDLYKDPSSAAIHFTTEAGGDTFVLADKEQLLRVFNNLLKNALQSIPDERSGKINILLAIQEENYIVSITDNGTGISEAQADKIFVPSFTTKTGGMGLGLAIVKNIVESSNGKIWFETTRNTGTTFFVSLPVYKP